MRIFTSNPDDRILDRSLYPGEQEGWLDGRMAHDRVRWRMSRPRNHDVAEELRNRRPHNDHHRVEVDSHLLEEAGHERRVEEVANEMGTRQARDGRSSRVGAGCDVCSHHDEDCSPWEVHGDRDSSRLAEDHRSHDEEEANEIGSDRAVGLTEGLWEPRIEGLRYM